VQWIEVGQPDERRLAKACGRAERVSLYVYGSAAAIWWAGIRNKLTRLGNLEVSQIESEQSQALAALAQRAMQWQVTIQDGTVWVSGGQSGVDSSEDASVELSPIRLNG